jgi:hypothetical protein
LSLQDAKGAKEGLTRLRAGICKEAHTFVMTRFFLINASLETDWSVAVAVRLAGNDGVRGILVSFHPVALIGEYMRLKAYASVRRNCR